MSAVEFPQVPPGLIDAIKGGDCVAFVGAGFSAAAGLPSWKALLKTISLSSGVSTDLREHVERLVDDPRASAHALDQAAQLMHDQLGSVFTEQLRKILVPKTLPPRMARRLRWLLTVPFRAILTLNFDGVMTGEISSGELYRRVLRREKSYWWQEEFWAENPRGATTVKLHGDLLAPAGRESIVLTREGYRRRLYADPAYSSFLRSLFATSTLLYLGCSFEDAYLNELRSEVLALLGFTDDDRRPIAYAVLNDVSPVTLEHFRRHEGIVVLDYVSIDPPDHAGFDCWLEAIQKATNPLGHLGKLVKNKRLLWMDPHPENNGYGVEVLKKAAELASEELKSVVMLPGPDLALRRLEKAQLAGEPFDLVISYWGRGALGESPGSQLLLGMRARQLHSPVVIFAGQANAEQRKRQALALGAQAYCVKFETLFQRIEQIFASARDTW